MVETAYLINEGSMIRDRVEARPQLEPSVVLILTWTDGYLPAVQRARQLKRNRKDPVLLKLASQDSPDREEAEMINGLGLWLLTVSNKFKGTRWNEEDLFDAVRKAALQRQEGVGAWISRPSTSPVIRRDAQPTTRKLTDDEKKAYLRAMYGDGTDDGVR